MDGARVDDDAERSNPSPGGSMTPMVSIIMPAYSPRPGWLLDAVRSALDEPGCPVELIVVDDGSPEPVEPVLAQLDDPRVRTLRVAHVGPYGARNAGIATARGEFVRFIDADDVVERGSTGRLLALANGDGESLAYGATLMCNADLVPHGIVGSRLEGDVSEACVLGQFEVFVVSMVFPRSVVERAGPWEEHGFEVSGDWDFVLRCLELAPVRRLDAIVTRYRRNRGSITRSASVEAGARAGRLVLGRYFARHPDQRGSDLERRAYVRLHLDRARAHAAMRTRGAAIRHLASAARYDAPATCAEVARAVTPEPAADRMRLWIARRMESDTRRSGVVRGAAIVFHAVAPAGGDPRSELDPAVAIDRLDAVIGYLARRYRLVSASELPEAARLRRRGDRVPIAVTFDDDLPSHRDHALPVLSRHGAIATVFLCGAGVTMWWRLLQDVIDDRAIEAGSLPHVDAALVSAALERQPGAIGRIGRVVEQLTPAQRDAVADVLRCAVSREPAQLAPDAVSELVAAGWEVGFHTRRHDLLTTLDEESLRAALADSNGARTLAYPHGKATERERRAAADAGYLAAYTGRAEALHELTPQHLIGRLQPDTTSVGRFAHGVAQALAVR
jgi:peptidoglycan/xylan/chitin deacetylase (PgdA/CDA1 family)